MKILIVDDVNLMHLHFKNILVDTIGVNDHDIFVAKSVTQALDIMHSVDLDIIFLDIMLPDMDGIDAIKLFKRIQPEARIIMQTAKSDKETIVRAIQKGAESYIKKPLSLESIIKVLGFEKEEGESVEDIIVEAESIIVETENIMATAV